MISRFVWVMSKGGCVSCALAGVVGQIYADCSSDRARVHGGFMV